MACLLALMAVALRDAGVLLASAESQAAQPAIRTVDRSPHRAPFATLLVQRFSGEFTEWADELTISSGETLTFRWSTVSASADGGVWQVSGQPFEAGVPPLAAPVLASGALPPPPGANPAPFTISFQDIVGGPPPPAPRRYYVRVVPLKDGQPAGHTLPVVTIVYARPPSGTTFQFDTLRIVAISPDGPVIGSAPSPFSSSLLTDLNSIEITYSYELNTKSSASIRQFLLDDQFDALVPVFSSITKVGKGKGTIRQRVSVHCTPSSPRVIATTYIKYELMAGSVLAKGYKYRPITVRCPERRRP